jgi:hypothetical protein
MRKFILFSVLLLPGGWAFGQLDNRAFEDRMAVNPADSGKLFLGVNILGFAKDNEYDDYRNPVITGYTLMGYQFNPYLSYHVNKNIRVNGGIYLQKDFGNPDFTTIAPILSIKYQHKNFSVILGNLESSLNHRLIEPLYDFERVLNNRLENGVQAQLMRDDLFLDAWIDWQKMIYFYDNKQEQLTAGLNLTKRIQNSSRTQVYLPFQLVTHHQGGQINFAFSGPIQTVLNTAMGLEVRHQTQGLIRETRLNGYYVYYKTLTPQLLQPFKDGSGAYFNLTASTKYGLDIMGTYWFGHEFITAEGGKIYPSVSVYDYTKQHHVMSIFILRFLYTAKINDGLYISGRFEPYYDFYYQSIQYSVGLYFNFRNRFFLWKNPRS